MTLTLARGLSLSANAGPTRGRPGWEASVCLWLRGPALAFGWGWDEESPVRPWPTVNTRPYRGCPRVVLGCLGFFLMLAFVALPVRK